MFKFGLSHLTGWRRMAAYLTILVFFMTFILVATLIASLYGIHDDAISIRNDTVLWEADCNSTDKANLWLHLAINIISTAILASSNFFMQVLVAPTRKDVDKAHEKGHWVEIGVHSLRNLFIMRRHKKLLWFLFSITSVPLHLVFNGCILESRASNAFWVLVTSEKFLEGDPWVIRDSTMQQSDTVTEIQNDIISSGYIRWENISWTACMDRYNSPEKMMYEHRHAIMVDRSATAWNVAPRSDGAYKPSSIWGMKTFIHVDSAAVSPDNDTHWLDPWEAHLLIVDQEIRLSERIEDPPSFWFRDGYFDGAINSSMKISYCLSEKSPAPCGLIISNSLLLIVCSMCGIKCILCIITLMIVVPRKADPLITPGDTVASFIANPGEDTHNMCGLSSRDLTMYDKGWWEGHYDGYTELKKPKPWVIHKGTVGEGITRTIWGLSYLPIMISLFFAVILFVEAVKKQPIKESRFEHDPMHQPVNLGIITTTSLLGLTIIANIPQLLLSVCYMTLNGLVTRMMTEYEWSRYSTEFRSLRVTSPAGQQRSTYRLQLPYRWSIPILFTSVLLHWVYSNCIYVSNYNYYDSNIPYSLVGDSRGLKHSTLAILIALIISSIIVAVPIILSRIELPGNMTLGGCNSKVISAACHCIIHNPTTSSATEPKFFASNTLIAKIEENTKKRLNTEDPADTINAEGSMSLYEMSLRKLKWGEILQALDGDGIGHLGFGTEDQDVTTPVEGRLYS